ncbi:hypothetical protein DY000_02006867 [Brassica cretica]|uniref:Uncharacterized protein n=1 Tax=Brassica cretica TaxID=69181 RepID=A0ABQ7BUP8_BRACR|nr:hypothetical protein DY000_02006867 [Brassica cretica]
MSRDYVRGRGSRDVWTSDAAFVGGGSETSGLATQIVWGVGAETFAFDATLEGGGTETDCTSDAAYASCLFMLELNIHSGSFIYSSQWFACIASHTSRSNSHVTDPSYSIPVQMRLTSRSDCYRTGVYQLRQSCSEIVRMWICDVVAPKLQAIAPRVFVIRDYVRHGYFVNSWGSLLDWVRQLALCDIGVTLVMLGGPIGSGTLQRWSCVLQYHSWDGLVITTSSTVGLPEGKSSYFWSRADFICIHATCRGVIGYGE